jgi:hypothetical protein
MTRFACALTQLHRPLRTRKHIDWEIFSSMIDGKINKRSGILVINLPTIRSPRQVCAHGVKPAIVNRAVASSSECLIAKRPSEIGLENQKRASRDGKLAQIPQSHG